MLPSVKFAEDKVLVFVIICENVPFRSYRRLLFKFWTLCVFEPPSRA